MVKQIIESKSQQILHKIKFLFILLLCLNRLKDRKYPRNFTRRITIICQNPHREASRISIYKEIYNLCHHQEKLYILLISIIKITTI